MYQIVKDSFIFKKKVRKLKDSRLRKVRYELRTLLHLTYRDRLVELRRCPVPHIEINKLQKHYHRSPISCWACGNRIKDLVKDPETGFWFCVDCFIE